MNITAEGQTEELEVIEGEVEETLVINTEESEPKNEEDSEVIVTIGEESPPTENEPAPEWVRELRKGRRDDKRRIRELEEKLNAKQEAETKPAKLGKKPSLEDFDYDTEKFEHALDAWKEAERQVKESERKAQEEQTKQQQAWQEKLDAYQSAKAKLKIANFDDAELVVIENFSPTQQGIIIKGATDPALVFAAIGGNETKAKELSKITDPIEFAFAISKLETTLKVTTRKPATTPEKTVQGTRKISGAVDSTLERLRNEAEKTNDYTKVNAYKRQMQK